MKKLNSIKSSGTALFCWLLLFYVIKTEAQVNYVLNPSLEKYDTCPYDADQIRFVHHWSAIDSNAITPWAYGQPDYLNECVISHPQISVPLNDRFYHYPRTGKGMAQILIFADSNQLGWDYQRDYLQGRFIKPLTAGKSYCISYYVGNEQQNNYATNHIDAYLDDGHIDTTHHPSLPQTQYVPQIIDATIITDILNWIKVEGTYIANGTEKFITIGNFKNIPNTTHIIFDTNSISSIGGANYLIDDVSVIESDHIAFAGNDTTIHKGDSILLGEIAVPYTWYKSSTSGLSLIDSTSGGIWVKPDSNTTYVVKQTLCGIETWDTVNVSVAPLSVNSEQLTVNRVSVYPNPVGESLTISLTPALSKGEGVQAVVQIFNIVRQVVYRGVVNEGRVIISTKDFAKGVYYLQVTDENGNKEVRKIIKE